MNYNDKTGLILCWFLNGVTHIYLFPHLTYSRILLILHTVSYFFPTALRTLKFEKNVLHSLITKVEWDYFVIHNSVATAAFLQCNISFSFSGAQNKFAKFLLRCLKCCFWCLEKCIKFLNRNAYIMVSSSNWIQLCDSCCVWSPLN